MKKVCYTLLSACALAMAAPAAHAAKQQPAAVPLFLHTMERYVGGMTDRTEFDEIVAAELDRDPEVSDLPAESGGNASPTERLAEPTASAFGWPTAARLPAQGRQAQVRRGTQWRATPPVLPVRTLPPRNRSTDR